MGCDRHVLAAPADDVLGGRDEVAVTVRILARNVAAAAISEDLVRYPALAHSVGG